MLDNFVEFTSREGIVDLIVDCLNRPAGADLPVILALGTRGSGKTALLNDIHRSCSGVRPCAMRRLGPHMERPHEVAVQLAFGLSERAGQFGRLRFPRLMLGLVVTRNKINQKTRDTARSDLRGLLDNSRKLMATVRQTGDNLLKGLGARAGTRTVFGLALYGLEAVTWTARLLQGPGFTWYRQALGRPIQDPLDALIDLNRLETEHGTRSRDKVDEVLCRAFLADLRAARSHTANYVALIDDADSRTAQDFLKVVVTERRNRYAANPRESCDPLVIIATGHTRLSRLAAEHGPAPRIRSSPEAAYDAWLAGRDRTPESWLYPVALGGLDVHDLAAWAHEGIPGEVVSDFAHHLTHGHMQSVMLVLRAVAVEAEHAAGNINLGGILDWPDPDHPERTLADGAIDRMLPRQPDDLRHDLITCSAARDLKDMPILRALARQAQDLDRFCSTDLWIVRPDDRLEASGDPRPRGGTVGALHPFLRRVLLHSLARRVEDDPDRWHAVHSRLRDFYRDEEHDVTGAMYHTLAVGDLAPVVTHLAQRFVRGAVTPWIQELETIASAPRRPTPGVPAPYEQVEELASGRARDIDPLLAWLVAAVWINTDLLSDPSCALNLGIAHHYDRLADRPNLTTVDREALHARAQEYREVCRGHRREGH